MENDPRAASDSQGPHPSHVNAALVVSVQSVVWTVIASSVAIVLGLRSRTAVLVAFGAIGLVDAIGSVALVHHFRHGLRNDALSDDLERLAHRIVLVGLLLVGGAAIAGGFARLVNEQSSQASSAGVILATASLAVLIVLSARKRSIARRVSSNALLSDGHLSAIGAMQAGVTVAGTAATRWAGWEWADAIATVLVGCVAVMLAIATWRSQPNRRRRFNSEARLARIAFVLVSAIALADAILGRRVILIGLLVVGPALSAMSVRFRATAFVSVWSVVLAIALGAPDHIWFTFEHALWVGAVLVVSLANTAVAGAVAAHHRTSQSESPWSSATSH